MKRQAGERKKKKREEEGACGKWRICQLRAERLFFATIPVRIGEQPLFCLCQRAFLCRSRTTTGPLLRLLHKSKKTYMLVLRLYMA